MFKSIHDLKAAAWNPRDIHPESLESLKVSLSEFGDISGIVFNERSSNLVCGHQRLRGLIDKYGDANLAIEGNTIVTPDGHRFNIRVVDWDDVTERAANVAANSERLSGFFTDDLQDVLTDVNNAAPDLAADLQLNELLKGDLWESLSNDKTPSGDGGDDEDDDTAVVLDQSLQLEPPKEYVVVVCDSSEEWERLKNAFGLGLVRRGGYRPNTKQDTLGVQRVVRAGALLALLDHQTEGHTDVAGDSD